MAILTDFDERALFDSIDFTNDETFEMASVDLKSLAEELKYMIIESASSEFTSTQSSILKHIQDITIGDVEPSGGGYSISLYLGGDLWRPSLSNRSDGAYDIVGLFIHGWAPKSNPPRRVYGSWHGMSVWNRLSKEPMGFLSSAIEEFNQAHKHSGVVAIIDSIYR